MHQLSRDVRVCRQYELHQDSIVSLLRCWVYVIDQLDVDMAYLNADLEEEVYLLPPKGMEIGSKFVPKLISALYGLNRLRMTE